MANTGSMRRSFSPPLLMAVAVALLLLLAGAAPAQVAGDYVLTLESVLLWRDPASLPALPELRGLVLYQVPFAKDGSTWWRLRVGFFSSREDAEAVRQSLREAFPSAWIGRADAADLAQVAAVPAATDAAAPVAAPDRAAESMEQARVAMTGGDYGRAIALYTKVLETAAAEHGQQALEFLGLARARNGQLAHAKALYEKYLQQYPTGEGSQRVRQRLEALLSADAEPPSLGEATPARPGYQWDHYGSFGQSYRRDASEIDGERRTDVSLLTTDADYSGRLRTADWQLRARTSLGLINDFVDQEQPRDTRVSALYLQADRRDGSWRAGIGRQWSGSGGVPGRFDGAYAGVRLRPGVRLNAVAGYPVVSSRDGLDTDRHFLGLNVDLGPYREAWEINLFAIQQWADGLVDRRAVGGQGRYFRDGLSVFTLVDYDVLYHGLNAALVNINRIGPDRSGYYLIADRRRSPYLTTSNALQGQAGTSLDDLGAIYSEDQIQQLAADRTATSTTLTAGGYWPLSPSWQLNGELTATELSETPASGGVEAFPGTGWEYYSLLQGIGSGVLRDQDLLQVGLRFQAGASADTWRLFASERYPLSRTLRIVPRLRIDLRSEDDGDQRTTVAPSLQLNYLWARGRRLDLELGLEWDRQQLAAGTEERLSSYLFAGYRLDF